jgi:hypothetical protein
MGRTRDGVIREESNTRDPVCVVNNTGNEGETVKRMCLLPAVVAEIRCCLVFGEKFNDRAVLLCHDGRGWWKGLVIIGDEIYRPVKDDSIVQYCES